MNVLIVGAAASLGQPITRRLVDAGHRVLATSRQGTKRPENGATWADLDLTDPTNGDAHTFDAVVNSTYADVNRFARELGHAVPDHQYEYTVVPILEWQAEPVGIRVMDGPFMTVLRLAQSSDPKKTECRSGS